MKLSELALKNSQFTLVIYLMVIVLGITTVITMPRAEDPDLKFPEFPVVIIYPGTSPEDMEELVVKPLEQKIFALEDIKKVTSKIGDGIAVIYAKYNYNTDMDEKYQELIREVGVMRKELPEEIYSIDVYKFTPSSVNVLQLALISENAPSELLRKKAEDIQDELERIPALKNVEIHGLAEQHVRVDLHPEKMASMNIPVNMVIGAIKSELATIPGGNVEAGNKTFNVKISGKFRDVEDIKHTIVFSNNGKNVLLEDIAGVYQDLATNDYITRLNGHRCVFIVAAQKPGHNITYTQKAYQATLEKFKANLPSSISMVHFFDQADHVNKRLSGLGTDFLIAILLVAVTLLPLGFRSSLIVMISIPLSLSIGIILLNLSGFTLNQISIVGLVVALGLLVDDSIVVIENIERWIFQGYSRKEAVIKATQQIGPAVLGCTVTLIIAFLPLALMPDASGEFIRALPMAVIFSILASLLVSLTAIPLIAERILKEHHGPWEGNFVMRVFKRFLIGGAYHKALSFALNKPRLTLVITTFLFAGSLSLFWVNGFSLFPASEKPQFYIRIETPLQSNIDYTDSVAQDIEKQLNKISEVKFFASNVGKGNPQVYYNVTQANPRTDLTEILVMLEHKTNSAKKLEIIEQLRKKWSNYPGARIEVKNFEQGPPVAAPIEVRLFGDNLDTLRIVAIKVERMLGKIPGTLYINNPISNVKSDLVINVNKHKANLFGVPTINIGRTVRMAVNGLPVGRFTDDYGNNFDIEVGTPRYGRPRLDVFDNLYVNNVQGRAIPLQQIAKIRLETSPLVINHYNKNRTVSVISYIRKGYLTDNVNSEVIREMAALRLPKGYSYEMGGEYESRGDSFDGFAGIVLTALFLFVAVLILQFKSFRNTLIVLSVIPLGMVGAMVALWITGNSVSFVAIIGLIALAGIEVKNTILLVDFTNQMRREGVPIDEAIRSSSEIRFLPIVLTTLTAIGGMFPIAISTNPLISPLAIVIIGGLISSTLLSRIVTPVVYKLIPPKL